MELGTFGAILTFALEFEGKISRFYSDAAEAVGAGEVSEKFRELAAAGEKRLKVLERTRRECVAEMILEPIRGFRSEDYPLDTDVAGGTDAKDLLRRALAIQDTAVGYYSTASEKVSVPEVSRILQKIAKQHRGQKDDLEGLAQ